jgi:hypothetical protein
VGGRGVLGQDRLQRRIDKCLQCSFEIWTVAPGYRLDETGHCPGAENHADMDAETWAAYAIAYRTCGWRMSLRAQLCGVTFSAMTLFASIAYFSARHPYRLLRVWSTYDTSRFANVASAGIAHGKQRHDAASMSQ